MSKKSRYGPRTPLFDAVFGASVADLRERVKAPISDAVAEETVRTINRYFAPRGVKHALNAFRDEFHSIWNRYPPNDKYLQSQVAADFLARLFVKQIERNDFKLRW
ncbi:MAG: hypothetical protein IKK39_13805 [Thermoguttaceae bacterium]|nr:hypothetical protein [Thermoguttaceae bacterium]MBR4105122.1 hypothetical protein [Thermoguttaceae bacterium]